MRLGVLVSVTILGAGCAAAGGGVTRTYYVAADEVVWDYAPTDSNLITGRPWEGFDPVVMVSAPDRIGRKFKKAIFREYTDSTFATLKPRPPEWEHLGILGPLLRAVVGDTIRVVFRNNGSHPYSMHPHGVFYNKDSEGAPYVDGTAGADKADDGVPPGGTHVYLWPVPERAGPAPGEVSSVQWMYHSHAREDADLHAGLIGPMLVTARGKARADGSPRDVDRELVVAFAEFDENGSWFLDENIRTYAGNPKIRPRIGDFGDLYYIANLRETMNGFSFGHLNGLTMRRGERVRWYLFGTTGFEVHAPHWHGNTVVAHHMRTDVISVNTMEMVTADMVADNPGTWLFHCHVAPHLLGGMQAVYRVE
ncbi:MAG TPA: multicopper oxidase domain-containing protein [Gemmatimonadales bacterium]|nr:multicopper oxidase domain-containing protein [Gemmatimonadales bacterium]